MRRLLVLWIALGLFGGLTGCKHVCGICDCQGYGYGNATQPHPPDGAHMANGALPDGGPPHPEYVGQVSQGPNRGMQEHLTPVAMPLEEGQ